MEKISLITASYNSENTIRDTLESVKKQTYQNIQYVIVDGQSSDGTMEIVNEYDSMVSKAISERDKGIYDAYNKGLTMVDGDIIGFINSDDFYCDNTAIEKVAEAFREPGIEAVYADLVYVDQENTNKILRLWKSKQYHHGDFAKAFVPAHPTLFLRKSVYEKCGSFDLRYKLAADYEFMLRVFHKFKTKSRYIDSIIVKMRAGGATGESFGAIKRQNKEIFHALESNSVSYSKIAFSLYKIANRFMQRLKTNSVDLPSEEN